MPVNLLFDRPTLGQRDNELALYVTGILPIGTPGAAYEGRLQIHNAIGAARARQISGDVLPNGSSITVDQATMEVVIAWPPYQSAALPVNDGSFEGNGSAWSLGAGWAIVTDDGSTSQPQTRTGTHSLKYTGSGESFAEGTAFYPVTPGQVFNFIGYVKQGASDSNAVVSDAGVRFYDINKNPLTYVPGNTVISSDGPNFAPTQGPVTVQSGHRFARPAIRGNRIRQNKPMWFDDYSWTLSGAGVGINGDATFNITIQVDDAAGRSAIWTGTITVSVFNPATLADMTYWYDGDHSAQFKSANDALPSISNGDAMQRADSAAGIQRVLSGGGGIRQIPSVGIYNGFSFASLGDAYGRYEMFQTPATGNNPTIPCSLSDIFTDTEFAIVAAVNVTDADADTGVPYGNGAIMGDFTGYAGLTCYRSGGSIVFQGYVYGGGTVQTALPLNTFAVLTLTLKSGVLALRKNGVQVSSAASTPIALMTGVPHLGRQGNYRHQQLFTFKTVPSPSDLLKLEQFAGVRANVVI